MYFFREKQPLALSTIKVWKLNLKNGEMSKFIQMKDVKCTKNLEGSNEKVKFKLVLFIILNKIFRAAKCQLSF